VTELGGWLPALLGEGARDPRGGVDEYLALCAPWSFAPEDISVPVRIFQGTADTLVPQRWAQQLVRRIPGSSVSWFPGEGHFIGVTRRRAVLEFLAAAEPHDAASPPE
jgi:pimeloyl-ACP methyl ester carboxylesterase